MSAEPDRPIRPAALDTPVRSTPAQGASAADDGRPSKRTPMRCSTCGQPFFLELSRTPPFCSPRCQLVDLQHWFDESIGVPFEGEPDPQGDRDL